MGGYLLSLQPTFTQGFILGQISILFLLALILKYLFWHSGPEPQVISLPPRTEKVKSASSTDSPITSNEHDEPMEWFNAVLFKIIQTYREQFQEHMSSPEAEELIRTKIEDRLNASRPANFLDPFKVHSFDIGTRAPTLSNPRLVPQEAAGSPHFYEFELSYRDSVSISLSTSILLHYPRPYFARLPIAVSLSLAEFTSKLMVVPPAPSSPKPTLTFTLKPDFTLNFDTNSLIGSRAKLADVPKIHDMIESQIRRFLVRQGTWTIVLPTLTTERDSIDPTEKDS